MEHFHYVEMVDGIVLQRQVHQQINNIKSGKGSVAGGGGGGEGLPWKRDGDHI